MHRLQQNSRVPFRANPVPILLVLLLSGCVSSSKRDAAQSTLWPEINSVVSSSPTFPIGGPVESNSPTPVKPALPSNKVYPQPTDTWIPLARWSRASNIGALAQ